jgi:UTP--glucose-1-phosphate uridylyltransferase
MGAAISAIPGAEALRVDRARFAPVKSTSDLLVVRSDAYVLTAEHGIVPAVGRPAELPPLDVRLDPAYYRLIDQLEARFPHGAPSLLGCASLEIRGDVRFGRGVVCRGHVRLEARGKEPLVVPDDALLAGA